MFGVQLPSLLPFQPRLPDLAGGRGEEPSILLKTHRQAASTSYPKRTRAEAKPCAETERAPRRGWSVGCPGPLLGRCTHLAPGAFPVSPRGPSAPGPGAAGGGQWSRLCCGPAFLRLQHKTRGVGAAPGSRVVARGLTPCHGEPGLWVPPRFLFQVGRPGLAWESNLLRIRTSKL